MIIVGVVYIITNDVNSNVYIGKTYTSIDRRLKQHIYDSRRMNSDNHYIKYNKLSVAIREIGAEHFSIEALEYCSQGELEEKEIEYIEIYNSMYSGYNSTPGGDTWRKVAAEDIEEDVVEAYMLGASINSLARSYAVSPSTIGNILRDSGLDTSYSFESMRYKLQHTVYGVHRHCGQLVTFENEYQAAVAVVSAKLSKQLAYYVKNDILRSIKQPRYGVGGYLWYDNIEKAEENSRNLKSVECSKLIIPITGSSLVRAVPLM